jgi:hypothetical protein
MDEYEVALRGLIDGSLIDVPGLCDAFGVIECQLRQLADRARGTIKKPQLILVSE